MLHKRRTHVSKMQQGRVCRSFQATGHCSYGSRCRFVHAADAFEPLLSANPQEEASASSQSSDRAAYISLPQLNVHQRLSCPEPQRWPAQRSAAGRSSSWQSGGRRGSWEWGQGRGGGRGSSAGVRGGRASTHGSDVRRWLYHPKQQGAANAGSFLALSYNILSSQLAADHAPELYWHVPPAVLAWEQRWRAILEELQQLAPDIVSLQEVDHFEEIQADLASLGFEGTFKGRTGVEMTDGCATFWKADKFSLVAVEELEFRDLNLRENVALLTVLKYQAAPDTPARLLVVANTHILFNPKRGDIKLAQLRHLLEQAHDLAVQHGGAPVLLMGDFNSSPESALYHYLSTGRLDLAATDRRNMSGQMEGYWHDGRPWQPYRPSTRISVPPNPPESISPQATNNAAVRGSTSVFCNSQAAAAGSVDDAPEELRRFEEAEARLPESTGEPAGQAAFHGLSASLGQALGNEPGLEVKRGRGEEPGPTDDPPAGRDSDREEGLAMDIGDEQAPRRRRLQSEEVTGGTAGDRGSDREESGTSSSGRAESAQDIGFRSRLPNREETRGAQDNPIAGSEGAQVFGSVSHRLQEEFETPPAEGRDEAPGSEPTSTSAAAGMYGAAGSGTSNGWQPQQRNGWGRRRPPGIDYVWDEEEFLIAAGGGRESVVRHPLEGLRSAYATVRRPRFRGEALCAREPACTTFHTKARGTVDYIWFSPGLQPLRVLDTPPMQSLQRLRGLPTERWPSDHFCIACEFAFEAASQ